MLFKNAYFRPGSFLTCRCYHCGSMISLKSENNQILLKIEKVQDDFDEDDENQVVSLSL